MAKHVKANLCRVVSKDHLQNVLGNVEMQIEGKDAGIGKHAISHGANQQSIQHPNTLHLFLE